MNKVILLGRVGQEPELITNDNSNITKFSLATNETYKNKQGERITNTEWHNIVVFGKQADVISQYVKKGQQLLIEGKIKTDSWDSDGVKKYKTNIVMNSFNFISSNNDDNHQSSNTQSQANNSNQEEHDDLPF